MQPLPLRLLSEASEAAACRRQGLYWSGKPTNETLKDYARFEFGWEAADAVTEAVAILEPTYAMLGSDQSQRALDLLRSAMPSMTDVAKRSWRWRILYLRALIDALLRDVHVSLSDISLCYGDEAHGPAVSATLSSLQLRCQRQRTVFSAF